jgi:hypothetical protein
VPYGFHFLSINFFQRTVIIILHGYFFPASMKISAVLLESSGRQNLDEVFWHRKSISYFTRWCWFFLVTSTWGLSFVDIYFGNTQIRQFFRPGVP